MKKRISATELAKLGKCEKQLILNNVYQNTKENKEVEEKRLKGIEQHKVFEENNKRIMENQRNTPQYDRPVDKRCYLATAIFGVSAPETIFLRKWRDDFLKKYYFGRVFIKYYYSISPFLIRKSPAWIKPLVKNCLKGFIKLLRRKDYE